MRRQPRQRTAFSLFELLIVTAILAIVASAMLVAYDSVVDRAASAQSSFNVAATERALRTFAVIHGSLPNDWDSLLTGDASRSSFVPDDLLDRLNPSLAANLRVVNLNRSRVDSLAAVGITRVRDIDTGNLAVNQYNDDDDFSNDEVAVPNRIFDAAVAGSGWYGVSRTLRQPARLAGVRTNSPLGRLLKMNGGDMIVALGLGNNNTCSDPALRGALPLIPFADVEPGEYGRFIVLVQVRDDGTDLPRARFLMVIDPRGNTLDQALASYDQ